MGSCEIGDGLCDDRRVFDVFRDGGDRRGGGRRGDALKDADAFPELVEGERVFVESFGRSRGGEIDVRVQDGEWVHEGDVGVS